MGWKGTLRSINAAAKRYDREAEKRERARIRESNQLAKLNMVQSAQDEVDQCDEYIHNIQSIHKEASKPINWERIASSTAPVKPKPIEKNEYDAIKKYETFKPNLFHKLLKRVDKVKSALKTNIELARQKDLQQTQHALEVFQQEFEEWKSKVEFAKKLLALDHQAFQEVINQFGAFNKISELGSEINFYLNSNNELALDLYLHSKQIIPNKIKTLLKSGKLSVKDMPKGKYHELHQDYVCSAVLRTAREVFALFPVDKVIITTMDEMLDKSTGHLSDKPILSVLVTKETISKLKFDTLDPSDAMTNFIHHMAFKKTTGFMPVEKVDFV